METFFIRCHREKDYFSKKYVYFNFSSKECNFARDRRETRGKKVILVTIHGGVARSQVNIGT